VLKWRGLVPYPSATLFPSVTLGFLGSVDTESDAGGTTAMNPLNSIWGTILSGFVLAIIIAAIL